MVTNRPDVCRKKIHFETKRHAKERARKIKGELGTKIEPYRCQHCGGWHLTSHTDMRYKIKVRKEQREKARNY